MAMSVTRSSELIAVVDIGSNSVRLVVFQRSPDDDLRPISEVKSLLRLDRETGSEGRLGDAAVDRLVTTLRDFRRVAEGCGAAKVLGVATSAIRGAVNADHVLTRIQEATGFNFEILGGEEEARYSFFGAVSGLPVSEGLFVDLGGGSLEVTRFKARRLVQSWSLRLGALYANHAFLQSDPPTRDEINALEAHAHAAFVEAQVPTLEEGGALVGTGGTLRNLAKVDRRRARNPGPKRLHGYVLDARRLSAICQDLSREQESDRKQVKGLNPQRSDSILGGALVLNALTRYSGASDVVVAGRGLREGLVLVNGLRELPSISEAKQRAITGLGSRFATWRAGTALRRARVARQLAGSLSKHLSEEWLELVGHAAQLVDTGSSINYYNRFAHAAAIVDRASLSGFTHREEALVAAALRAADNGDPNIKPYRPVLSDDDWAETARAGILLAIAEGVELRLPPDREPTVSCEVREGRWHLRAEGLAAWDAGTLMARFNQVFGLKAVLEGDAAP